MSNSMLLMSELFKLLTALSFVLVCNYFLDPKFNSVFNHNVMTCLFIANILFLSITAVQMAQMLGANQIMNGTVMLFLFNIEAGVRSLCVCSTLFYVAAKASLVVIKAHL